MSLWAFIFIPIPFIFSWWVTNKYIERCKSTAGNGDMHGAMEFNLALFSSSLIMFWIVVIDKKDSWKIGLIGAILAAILVRRFWTNWNRQKDEK